ncbi:hypothetical protein DLD99_09260 [Pseudomonas kribbensis]|uniref:Uncharacterized protein n=1 Tax=Pseudomonas kribbensis TaxID=1628086 RepID=A0A345RMY3_9PSED|nr:hypothetical protein DLD99_09260 [Pseudomonas kribbensis]
MTLCFIGAKTPRNRKFQIQSGAPVGASLLAKASCQPTSMLNERPHSRASSLPQGSPAIP